MDVTVNKKRALIFGATGLTGRFVTEMLSNDTRFNEVTAFVRNKTNFNKNVSQVEFNTDNLAAINNLIKGDYLFCCLGTTIKQAGSKENFRKIDLHLVEEIAKMARQNHVPSFTVISSIGASASSRNFYLRTKGQMEQSIQNLGFKDLHIMRPSMLLGMRPNSRPLEDAGKVLIKLMTPLMIGKLKKYKPVHGAELASFMIETALEMHGTHIYESDMILNR